MPMRFLLMCFSFFVMNPYNSIIIGKSSCDGFSARQEFQWEVHAFGLEKKIFFFFFVDLQKPLAPDFQTWIVVSYESFDRFFFCFEWEKENRRIWRARLVNLEIYSLFCFFPFLIAKRFFLKTPYIVIQSQVICSIRHSSRRRFRAFSGTTYNR